MNNEIITFELADFQKKKLRSLGLDMDNEEIKEIVSEVYSDFKKRNANLQLGGVITYSTIFHLEDNVPKPLISERALLVAIFEMLSELTLMR